MEDYKFEWTDERAQQYLEKQNRFYWGSEYNQERNALRFGSPFIGSEINMLLNNLVSDIRFGQMGDKLAMSGDNLIKERAQRLGNALSEVGTQSGRTPLQELAEQSNLQALSAEDRARMIMSAADFLGIEYDQTIFPKVSFFPSPEQ